ncbi:MAG: hypothetical protein AABW73_02575 [Nanoarchaeota archaeon]
MSRKVYIFTPRPDRVDNGDWGLMRSIAIIHRGEPIDAAYFDVNQKFRDVSPLPRVTSGFPPTTEGYCKTNGDKPIDPRLAEDHSDFLRELTIGDGRSFSRVAYVNKKGNGNIAILVDNLQENGFETERVYF